MGIAVAQVKAGKRLEKKIQPAALQSAAPIDIWKLIKPNRNNALKATNIDA